MERKKRVYFRLEFIFPAVPAPRERRGIQLEISVMNRRARENDWKKEKSGGKIKAEMKSNGKLNAI